MFLKRLKRNQKNTAASRDLLLAVQEYVRRNYRETDADSGADDLAAYRMQMSTMSGAAMQAPEPDEEALPVTEAEEGALPASKADEEALPASEADSALSAQRNETVSNSDVPKFTKKRRASDATTFSPKSMAPGATGDPAVSGTTMIGADGMPYAQPSLRAPAQAPAESPLQPPAEPPVQASFQTPLQASPDRLSAQTAALSSARTADQAPVQSRPSSRKLEDLLKQMDETFSQMLLRLIDERGLKDSEVYHKANIDRRLFSKIRNDVNYTPTKKTVLAFAVALELSMDETRDLLRKAGYALSNSSRFDVIVSFFFETRRYDMFEINEVLMDYGEPLLCE